MKLFGLYSGLLSSANCYMRIVRGAVLSPTLIGSASTHSCSEVNAVDFVRRTYRGLTNFLKAPTLFHKVTADSRHVLHQLLPPLSSASQN